MKHLYEAMLMMSPGIARVREGKLFKHFHSADAVWKAGRKELAESGILGSNEIDGLLSLREELDATEMERQWTAKGIQICSMNDEEYPPLLRKIYDPPALLFYRGRLDSAALYLAVVGSRRSTPYGRNVARAFCENLSRAGVVIVSGAAKGIDAAAHEGALSAEAPTVAVLGCGVDVAYPAENARLIDKISEKGCVVSEYPPGTPPAAGRFPARNRIVAGMSYGVLVVEAAEKSGALITADIALNENRDVYAIPGSIFSEASRGTHRLIQQGARLIENVEELLDELGLAGGFHKECGLSVIGTEESRVLQALSHDHSKCLDELVLCLEMEPSQLHVILLQLEMAGYVVKEPSMEYIRAVKE